MTKKIKVMFVCLGNICRSPAAESILRKKAEEIGVDIHIESSGLGDWHVGSLADERTRNSASKRGFVLCSRAKKFEEKDFDEFDYILAADNKVLHHLQKFADLEQKAKLSLFTKYSSAFPNKEVPDPFYGGEEAFENVLDILEDACEGFIAHLKTK